MNSIASITMFFIIVSAAECLRYPIFPDEFKWSNSGRLNDTSYKCVQILEPSDPDSWDDNYLCFKSGETYYDANLHWSYSGKYLVVTLNSNPPPPLISKFFL